MVKKSCKVDDNNWALRLASDLEDAAKQGNQREVWQKIRILSNKRSKKSTAVRDKSGKLISDPDVQRERWAEHFSELLNPQQDDSDLTVLDGIAGVPSFDYLGDSDGPPTREEIQNALKKLKNHKSPGIDEITNEQLKYGAPGLTKALEILFAKVWDGEVIPEDWSKGIIIVLPKKGDSTYCSNNRGITLRSTASKLFQIIVLGRINKGLESLLRENQCGFRKNRSCIDQIYSLQTIIHKTIEYNIPLYINFIDFKAAFDSIKREFIWKAFSFYGLPAKYIRVLQAFFYNTVSAVRVNGEQSNWFNVESGTGQGDIQGPPVFNVCINLAAYLTEQNKQLSTGAVLLQETPGKPAVSVMDTDYADDMALLDNTKPGLQETTDLLCNYSSLGGLKANAKKTQSMAIGKHITQRPYTEEETLSITVEGCEVEQVSTFTYLGTVFSSDGTMDAELSQRIQKASGAFSQLGKIWNNSHIHLSTKIKIYEAAIFTILTYGSEVWVTTKAQSHRLEAFHQRCLRRILRVRWFHRVTNQSVLEQTGTTSVEAVVAANRIRWLGHMIRMPKERLPRFLLDWNPNHGKRSRGRPRRTWLDSVLDDIRRAVGNTNLTLTDIEGMALDRANWRRIAARRRGRTTHPDAGDSPSDET
ncbi:Hypp5001 [Branchiostoma lanceolatum]|uniref:Hypp5001 protein n=1 Tax=Branchiostoma lanceolatum TaxID=7740 RepID=A0A8K0F0F9_BRALA|nr:Hypp5001 [Branchiostoma lanceolatum]